MGSGGGRAGKHPRKGLSWKKIMGKVSMSGRNRQMKTSITTLKIIPP